MNGHSAPALRVSQPGLWTTVQDLGRPSYRGLGVPVAGAFDQGSHRLANALLGNSAECATLELTILGGTYEALVPLAVGLAGAPIDARLEPMKGQSRALRIPQVLAIKPGDRLILRGSMRGARAYLAVHGGFRTDRVLGSRSREAPLRTGDTLAACAGTSRTQWPSDELIAPFQPGNYTPIRILPGPDAAELQRLDWSLIKARAGSACDRMGLRLELAEGSPTTSFDFEAERLSAPVAPGAIQATPAGLIVLGAACGTMGGYPHVAQVISADFDRLAQIRPGDLLSFLQVCLNQARQLDASRMRVQHELCLRLRVAASAHPV